MFFHRLPLGFRRPWPMLPRVQAAAVATRAATTVPAPISASRTASYPSPTSAVSWRKRFPPTAKSPKTPRKPCRNAFPNLSASSPASTLLLRFSLALLLFYSLNLLKWWINGWIELMFLRASDKCQREKRKTINGDDLLWAMATLGFEEYVDPLKIYLASYREVILVYIYLLMFTFLFSVTQLVSTDKPVICIHCSWVDA